MDARSTLIVPGWGRIIPMSLGNTGKLCLNTKQKKNKILNKRKKKGAKTERVTVPGHTHRAEDKP